jgi:hypothetical protein
MSTVSAPLKRAPNGSNHRACSMVFWNHIRISHPQQCRHRHERAVLSQVTENSLRNAETCSWTAASNRARGSVCACSASSRVWQHHMVSRGCGSAHWTPPRRWCGRGQGLQGRHYASGCRSRTDSVSGIGSSNWEKGTGMKRHSC